MHGASNHSAMYAWPQPIRADGSSAMVVSVATIDPCIAPDEIGVPRFVFTTTANGALLLVTYRPSLSQQTCLALRARLLRGSSGALRLHPVTLTLLQRGGSIAQAPAHEMHLQPPEVAVEPLHSLEALAEAQELLTLQQRLITPIECARSPACHLQLDAVHGAYLLTQRDAFFSAADAMELMSQLDASGGGGEGGGDGGGDGSGGGVGGGGGQRTAAMGGAVPTLPIPAILKPQHLWTGKQLVSATHLLPRRLSLHAFAATHPDDEEDFHSPGDTRVVIEGGELLSGSLDRKTLGGGSTAIPHAILVACGSNLSAAATLCCFLEGMSRLATHYLTAIAGASFGLQALYGSTDRFAQGVTDARREMQSTLNARLKSLAELHRAGNLEYPDMGCGLEELHYRQLCRRTAIYHTEVAASQVVRLFRCAAERRNMLRMLYATRQASFKTVWRMPPPHQSRHGMCTAEDVSSCAYR